MMNKCIKTDYNSYIVLPDGNCEFVVRRETYSNTYQIIIRMYTSGDKVHERLIWDGFTNRDETIEYIEVLMHRLMSGMDPVITRSSIAGGVK